MTWTNFEKRRGEKLIAWKILWWWWWLLDKQHWMYKRLALYLANLTHADHGIVLSQLIFLICLSWPSYHCFHSQCLHVDTIIPHQESRIFHKSSLIFYHLSANQCCQYLLKWIMQNTNAIKYIFLREYWCLWCWLRWNTKYQIFLSKRESNQNIFEILRNLWKSYYALEHQKQSVVFGWVSI